LFNLTLNFTDEDNKLRRKKMLDENDGLGSKTRGRLRKIVAERIKALEHDKFAAARIDKEIRELKQLRQERERQEHRTEIDFVEKNIEKLCVLNSGQSPKSDKPQIDEMIERAKINRLMQERDTLVRNLATLRKWDFIKDQRTMYEEYVRERELKRMMRTKWAKHAKALCVLTAIALLYKQRVAAIRLHQRKCNAIKRFENEAWEVRKDHLGQTINGRLVNRAR
jgi:hypothetical protein